MRYLLLVLLLAHQAGASECVGRDSAGCALPGNPAARGVCRDGGCVVTEGRIFVPDEPRPGTSTIESSGRTVTGTNTHFLTELHPGDLLTAAGQTQAVGHIFTDTFLQVGPTETGFAPVLPPNTTFTYVRPVLRQEDATGAQQLWIAPTGRVNTHGGPLGDSPQ